jgi:N-acetylneuraminic acid mutarotase
MTRLVRSGATLALLVLAWTAGGCVGHTTESPAPVDQRAPGRWTQLSPMPTARQEVAVAAQGGLVWVMGGFAGNGEPVATVETFDPAPDLWETRTSLPVPLHHAGAAVVGERLFVIGGYTGGRIRWTASDAVYEFVAGREAWEPRATMPTPRGGLAIAVLNGRVHALGGSGERVSNAHEVYDPAANRWSAANAMPTARDHLAAVAFQNHVWALGGRASFVGEQFANVEIYDPATDSWRTGIPLPVGRGGLAATALPDRILVFGGEAPLQIFNATEMWEVSGQRWIAKEPMPTPRHGIGAVVVDGRVFVPAGGTRPGLAATSVNEAYSP